MTLNSVNIITQRLYIHNRHLATESASASAPSSESMTSSMVNCCGNPCSGTGVPGSSRALIAFPVAMPACSAVELPASGCPLMKNSTEASGSESQRQKAAVTLQGARVSVTRWGSQCVGHSVG